MLSLVAAVRCLTAASDPVSYPGHSNVKGGTASWTSAVININSAMKILFPYMSRWRTANRSRYHQLLTHLCRRGHEVMILTAPPMALSDISSRDIEESRELPVGMEVSELFAPLMLRRFWEQDIPRTKLLKKGLISISSIPQLQRIIRAEKIDLLFLYNLPQILLMEVADCRVHFDLADDLVAMMEGEDRLLFRAGGRHAASAVQRRLVRKADTITVASGVLAAQIDRPLLLLPNGADITELDMIANVETAADGVAQGRSTPLIGFVGALEYWVNLELIVEVAARLPACEFQIVGGGRRLDELRYLVSTRGLRNVRLTGPKAYHEAMREVARMDVCLLPFEHGAVSDGSCPLKLFEYAALRRPVVSTTTTEVRRIGSEWVWFADTAEQFAAAINRALSDHGEVARRVGLGRQLVEKAYNWPLLAARFEDYLTGALAAGSVIV